MDAANIIVFENSKGDDGTRQLNRTVQKLRLLHPITPAWLLLGSAPFDFDSQNRIVDINLINGFNNLI